MLPPPHVRRALAPLLLCWPALIVPAGLHAQASLTLPEAVAIAQERGHQARAAAAAREAARYQHSQFRSGLMPQLSMVGTIPAYNRSIIPVLQPDGSTEFRSQQQTSGTLTMRLSQKLPVTGGDLFVSSSLQRLAVRGVQNTRTWSSTPFSIGLRQDILRPNVTAWDRREQGVQSNLDERLYLEALEDVAIETAALFFDVHAASVTLANATTNAATNDTLYRLNQGRFEVGKIGENDLLQSELALLRARTSLDGARLEYDRATAALRLALNLPAGTPIAIVVPDAIPAFEPDTMRAVTEALARRSSVSSVALQDVRARRRVTEARLSGGIGATVQASFGFNATAPEMRLAYQNLLEARQFTLSVEVPFWQWGAHGEGVHAAEAQRDQTLSLGQSTLEQTAHDAHYAALQLSQAARNVALSAKSDTVADKRFAVAYNRYVIGRITIDNLYLAQNEKDQALSQYVQSLRGYWQAYYRLRRMTLFDFERGEPIQ
jgi:outer membrane protein TolC